MSDINHERFAERGLPHAAIRLPVREKEEDTMAFCGQCGTNFEDGAKFCPACGAPAASAPQQTPVTTQPPPTYQAPVMPGAPAQDDIRDAQDNKVVAALAYIIFFIPLLAAKESKFARYHANQWLVLLIATVALSIVYSILTSILYTISWRVGFAVTSILGVVFLIPTALAIIGIINAVNGKKKPLPIIGGIKILK